MKVRAEAIKFKHLIEHETKNSLFKRFLIVLSIVIIYTAFVCVRYGFKDGLTVGFLTWSLFVFGTPIADAGVLLDFPIRLLTKIRMLYSEIMVWIIALSGNIFFLLVNPDIYQKNELTNILYFILTNPWPGFFLIFLCLLGTFITIVLGDELLDIKYHKEKKFFKEHSKKIVFVISAALFLMIFIGYMYIEKEMGFSII